MPPARVSIEISFRLRAGARRSSTSKRVAVPTLPSATGATRMLNSSIRFAARNDPLILPPPSSRSFLMPKRARSFCNTFGRSTRDLPPKRYETAFDDRDHVLAVDVARAPRQLAGWVDGDRVGRGVVLGDEILARNAFAVPALRHARLARVRLHGDAPDDPRIRIEGRCGLLVLAGRVADLPLAEHDSPIDRREHVADDVGAVRIAHTAE